jgi:hypothetical protein
MVILRVFSPFRRLTPPPPPQVRFSAFSVDFAIAIFLYV